jgi:putative redox protein
MKSERVSFLSSRNVQLAGRLDLPTRHTPKAYVLFAHCFTCSKEFKAPVGISKALARAGFGVLRFDFTGLGESEGDFAKTNFTTNLEDVLSAAKFLEREYQAPQVLVGHSFGAMAMIGAARDLPSVTSVVAIAAPAEPRHVIEHFGDAWETIEREGRALVQVMGHRVWIEQQFVDDVMMHEFRNAVRDLGKALLILHSPADEVVSIDHAAALFQSARHPKSFVTLDEADHLLSDRRDAAYVGDVIAAWVSRYLRVAPASESAASPEPKAPMQAAPAGPLEQLNTW